MLGALAGNGLEMFVKTGEIIEPAFIAALLDADPVIDEQLAGMTYTYFRQELRVGLSCSGFKVPAKGVGHQACNGGHFIQIDLLREMPEGIIVNGIDAVILQLGEIMPEAYGGKQMRIGCSRECGKTFDQRDDSSHSFR